MEDNIATKADLKKTGDALHSKIDSVKTELHSKIDSVKTELHSKIDSVKIELRTEIASVNNNLQKDIERVAIQVVQVSNDLHEFKQETREQHNTVMNAIDGLARLVTNGQTERAAVDHALRRHDHTLENHESRIQVLEMKEEEPVAAPEP